MTNDGKVVDRLNSRESIFKFVAVTLACLDEIEELQQEYELASDRVWVMPEGTSVARLQSVSAELAREVLYRGWNLTTRLHIQLWGDARGR